MNWRQFKRQLLADRRKSALVMLLLAVALLLWGRLLIKDVPRSAVAEPDKEVAADTAAPSDRSPPVPDKSERPVVRIRRYAPGERELFAFEPDRYPRAERPEPKIDRSPKSGADRTDEQDKLEAARMAAYTAARGLTLQSTLLGSPNRAMINGVLLEPGERILGFELKAVRNRQVTLARDGIEVTLEM
jgi:hypothetical protein